MLFFLLTLPTAIVSFFFNKLITTNEGKLFILTCNCISFSYHALNFFIYSITNIKFRSEMTKTFFNLNFSSTNSNSSNLLQLNTTNFDSEITSRLNKFNANKRRSWSSFFLNISNSLFKSSKCIFLMIFHENKLIFNSKSLFYLLIYFWNLKVTIFLF